MPVSPKSLRDVNQQTVQFALSGRKFPAPYWSTPGGNAALYLGDVRACLRRLPARSIHCVVTSPPYWRLRDYGRIDGQIGMEPSPDCGTHGQTQCGVCFVCSIVGVLHEVFRVLRDDGTCWLNLGDSYNNGGGNLIGIPWRVALALQSYGWILRQDIIWAKPNPMPESVTNRCTKSHEYIFLLMKSQGYYYDSDAISNPSKSPGRLVGQGSKSTSRHSGGTSGNAAVDITYIVNPATSNKRSVWTVSAKPYQGAHFAVFPPALITPCILAGTSEHGCCAVCGKSWKRVVVRREAVKQEGESGLERDRSFRASRNGVDSTLDTGIAQKETVGWLKGCGCQTDEVKPCIVLDPFVGSGTTVATSIQLGRVGIGIDLSETYLRDCAIPRIEDVMTTGRTNMKNTIIISRGTSLPPQKMRGTS